MVFCPFVEVSKMKDNFLFRWWKMLFSDLDDEDEFDEIKENKKQIYEKRMREEEPELLIPPANVRRKRKVVEQEIPTNHVRKYKRPTGPTPVERKVKKGVRMTYQYPEKTPFRFPVVTDYEPLGEEIVAQTKEKEKKIEKNYSTNQISQKQNRKEQLLETKRTQPFTGPFKRQDVPSPIYGFQKKDEEPEIFLDALKEGKNDEQNEKKKNQTEQLMLNSQEKPQENFDYLIEESQEKMQHDYDTFLENEQKEIEIKDEIENNHLDERRESDASFREAQKKEKEKQIKVQEEMKQTPRQEQLIKKQTTAIRKEKMKHQQGTPIPVNVLMLEKDRKNLKKKQNHQFPSITLLNVPERVEDDDEGWLIEQEKILNEAFLHFNVEAKVVAVTKGPTVTRFEVEPGKGVKVSKITNLTDDLKRSLAAVDIRIEAPIPGKSTVGIEVPNKQRTPVLLREVIRTNTFTKHPSPLAIALGQDIEGKAVVTDIKKMPHGLIAGATGSGKSVCINAMLVSLLYKATPEQVRLLLIDPKMVELAPYHHLPHLACPVITDVKEATLALKWAVEEMEERYQKFANQMVRDIEKYNEKNPHNKLPYLVVVIDELADLMMVAPHDVEDSICRIAQKARACGIHLVVATQRPSVDVITGLIKANIPTRIAFSVSSQVDSRTIIDFSGAEKLLGSGDMLFVENGSGKPIRLQGNFVSDDEIERITEEIRKSGRPVYLFEKEELIKKDDVELLEDELFKEACEFVLNQGSASSSSLQRRFHIGFNRAARLVDMMEAKGLVSGQNGSKPREVLMSSEEFFNDFDS